MLFHLSVGVMGGESGVGAVSCLQSGVIVGAAPGSFVVTVAVRPRESSSSHTFRKTQRAAAGGEPPLAESPN